MFFSSRHRITAYKKTFLPPLGTYRRCQRNCNNEIMTTPNVILLILVRNNDIFSLFSGDFFQEKLISVWGHVETFRDYLWVNNLGIFNRSKWIMCWTMHDSDWNAKDRWLNCLWILPCSSSYWWCNRYRNIHIDSMNVLTEVRFWLKFQGRK